MSQRPNTTILLVEPDAAFAAALLAVWAPAIPVVTVWSVGEAVARIRQAAVSMVVLDVELPSRAARADEVEGWEGLIELRRELGSGVPILVLMRDVDLCQAWRAPAFGASEVLSKAVQIDDLERAIERLLPGAPARPDGAR